MTRRAHITLKTKLASALCQMLMVDETTGKLVPVIEHEHAKLMSEDQILSVFDFDHHPIPKAHDGPDVHWNLTPRPRPGHRRKTAKVDAPMMAKVRHLTAAQEEFRAKVLARPCGQKRQPKGNFPSRPFRQLRNRK